MCIQLVPSSVQPTNKLNDDDDDNNNNNKDETISFKCGAKAQTVFLVAMIDLMLVSIMHSSKMKTKMKMKMTIKEAKTAYLRSSIL